MHMDPDLESLPVYGLINASIPRKSKTKRLESGFFEGDIKYLIHFSVDNEVCEIE
jgi:hypothetical protein